MMVAFIDRHHAALGFESICRTLQFAPSAYKDFSIYAPRRLDMYRLDNEVEMIAHNAQVLQPEIVLSLCPLHDGEE